MGKRRLAVALTAASTGGLAAAGGVLAQAAHPLASPSNVAALRTAALPGPGAAVLRFYGHTDNPHNSRHFPRDASVSSRTVCPGDAVTVTVWLYKRVNGSWRLLDTGTSARTGQVRAEPAPIPDLAHARELSAGSSTFWTKHPSNRCPDTLESWVDGLVGGAT